MILYDPMLVSWLTLNIETPGFQEFVKVIAERGRMAAVAARRPGDTDYDKGRAAAYEDIGALPQDILNAVQKAANPHSKAKEG